MTKTSSSAGPQGPAPSRAASAIAPVLPRSTRTLLAALAAAVILGLAPALALTGTGGTAAAQERDDHPDPAASFQELMYPSSSPATSGATDAAGTGQAIADFAAGFLGYPYVWAGNTPAGFDCSGFTQYVVLNVTGLDIGHGTEGQLAYGTPVPADQLLPGDLVYFAGTWGPGITHAGIYLGDGLFIHAENETTGVVISDLWGTYGGYYYSAIRIG